MDLKNVATRDLINELSTRKGVERSRAGLYRPYQLTKKYTGQRGDVEAECILIIRKMP